MQKVKFLFEEHLESARREKDIHKQLDHPNIVEIYDTTETEH